MAAHGEVLTTRQMRAIEKAAIASGMVTATQLMERAGASAAQAIAARWPKGGAQALRVLILCGPGNNGGDGYVVARHLSRMGWQPRIVALAPPVSPEAREMAAAWDGEVVTFGAPAAPLGEELALCVDALFGTGLTRALAPEIAGLLRGISSAGVPIAALDLPSGICGDSGRILGGTRLPDAGLTVTFHRRKLGHILSDGGQLCGSVVTCDIGLEPWQQAAGDCVTLAGASAALLKQAGHKYSHGHALVLAGGPGQGGAARLAATAALRIGAGLVTLGCPATALPENAARLDAVMLQTVDEPADLTARLRDPRLNALCLGPGLGVTRARALVPAALQMPRATVLDADALSCFADNPDTLFANLHDRCVLTPHDGEFARLFPDLARRLRDDPAKGPAFSRLDAARSAAARSGAVVLLKGPDTVIAAPDGQSRIADATGDQAAPWLATAGSGDVLAGIITGLLAREWEPLDAAATAAWFHAASARNFGPGLISEDLSGQFSAVFRALSA
ncbi:NAD(P)H-hydrate dehydratase [Paracoccus laeviglucosivorans]|uniref:Bifunctional NAD(P)H-hydrate repair enzyme n=1 Tax=Paracoccus laeviglucosivorans TaxID=1197861 RepID=A0A521CF80_9RHOB|nr:NAD(P)H-hydrate dehydratase [Paracoccus laeviglucosivorans]SMO57431.1 yjeF C-terminal region, hydroxyethylthiazole kinase-related/yjeF N-terminal region [Paracoccus laeviglucosivorans]